MTRRTLVFGPAYLDRVLRVDRPLIDPGVGPPLDQSVDGRWKFGPRGLALEDPAGHRLDVVLPDSWPGPTGVVAMSRDIAPGSPPRRRDVTGVSWQDDLGGMGAGFAAALGGELVSALGGEDDPNSRAVAALVARTGITHRPIRVEGQAADWTLLVSSGEFGDKLPIGFRGCHAALQTLGSGLEVPCDLRVVASLPNRLAEEALRAPGAAVRLFAPAMRNMLDHDPPLSRFAETIDVLCCNRHEWESLDDREQVAWQVSLLAVTDGAGGSTVRFTTPEGDARSIRVAAFPRADPPRDTNRAGEAYAATLLATLLDAGWVPGVLEEGLVRHSALRASAASALVLDRTEFGFPCPEEIDAAVRAGRVAGRPRDPDELPR